MMIPKKIVLTLACSVLLTGCSSIGPKEIHMDRASYNEIVRQTDYQQLLSSIVALAYLETASSSLSVTNVTASYSLSTNMSINPTWSRQLGQYGGQPSITQSLGVGQSGLGATYTDSPTISYSPVAPQQFVAVMQAPLTINDVSLFFNGGIDNFGLLSRLLFSSIGTLDNASGASDPLLSRPIQYKECRHLIELVHEMENMDQASIELVTINTNISGLMVKFTDAAINSADALEIKKMLNVPSDSPNIVFINQNGNQVSLNAKGLLVSAPSVTPAPNLVFVKSRSLYGILTFLSHAVEIPAADIKAHRVEEIRDNQGKIFDWTPLLKDIMTIRSSKTEPYDNVFVKTYLHGHWFYIEQSDLNSKATFMLLIRLITIKGGATTQSNNGPTLSIPV